MTSSRSQKARMVQFWVHELTGQVITEAPPPGEDSWRKCGHEVSLPPEAAAAVKDAIYVALEAGKRIAESTTMHCCVDGQNQVMESESPPGDLIISRGSLPYLRRLLHCTYDAGCKAGRHEAAELNECTSALRKEEGKSLGLREAIGVLAKQLAGN